jgi:predicted secreted protein
MSRIVKGKDAIMRVKIGDGEYKYIACGTNITLDIQRDQIELTDRTVGGWRKYLPGVLTGTYSMTGVVVLEGDYKHNIADIFTQQWGDGDYSILYELLSSEGDTLVFEFPATIENVGLQGAAQSGTLATYSISGRVNGLPTMLFTDAPDQNECFLVDSNGDYIVDSDGVRIRTGCWNDASPSGGMLDFSESDFQLGDFY